MLISRTTGSASVVPELVYADVADAVGWLCAAFGFTELWRAGGHRARVVFGNGTVIVADASSQYGRAVPGRTGVHSHGVTVKVENLDAHFDQARQQGARIVSPPADYPYGERQYTAEDLAGHRWTFTQAIADLAPEDWGGTSNEASGQSFADRQIAEAMAAEHESLSLECRADARRLERLLAPDFHEFGASGGEIGYEGTAARVAAATDLDGERIHVENMRGWLLADNVVMLKYTSANSGRRSNRTSLWRRTATGRWQIFHHQGTLTAR